MDLNSGESLNLLEESISKMINDFSHSFEVLNKSDSQVILWLETLHSIVTNILDVYKILILTRNSMFCQNVLESLDGLKKIIKSITSKERKLDIGLIDTEKNLHCKDSIICKYNLDSFLEKKTKSSSDVDSSTDKSDITFGDVDYELIMNDLKKDKTCDDYLSPNKFDSCLSKKSFSESCTQTDLSILNSTFFKKVQMCSVGTQVDCVKHTNYSAINFSSDYNLNDPYQCNQNFDDSYPNLHYYNDNCSYPSELDGTYQEHVSNFSHQYPPLPCTSVPLPGRNISAPIFLPRIISPSPGHHTNEHHHSSLPYAITMFSSSQSYVPSAFNGTVSPNHYLGITSNGPKESKRSHRKSELLLTKRNKGSTSRSKDDSRNSQPKPVKCICSSESNKTLKSSSDERIGYLAKIDLLEKACNFDLTPCQYYFSSIDFISSSDDKLDGTNENNNGCIKQDSEKEYNLISDFENVEGKLTNIITLNKPDDPSEFPNVSANDIEVSNHKKSINFNSKTIGFCENQNISVLSDVFDNTRTSSKCINGKSKPTSLLNECHPPKLGSFESQINSRSSLSESLDDPDPILETNNNNLDDNASVSKKMDVKLSFVNVLTAGLKVSTDAKICSVKNTLSIDDINESDCSNTNSIKPPNVFELSHFPCLKRNSQQAVNNSEQVLYFGHCKAQISPSLFVSPGVIGKNGKGTSGVNDSHRSSRSTRSVEKSNFNGKSKDSDRRSTGIMNKSPAVKKNLPLTDSKKNSDYKRARCSYQVVKHSNISSYSKYVKEGANSTNLEKKVYGSLTINRKCKPEEVFQSKRSTLNKRKSVPGEDGWTVIPTKFRNPDCWNSKDLVNKRVNDFTLLGDSMIKSNTELTEMNQDPVTNSSELEEDRYTLPNQQHYFSKPVLLEHSTSFFEETSSVIDNFDICHELKDSSFALAPVGIIDSIGDDSKTQITSPDDTSGHFPQSDYQVPSSLVTVSMVGDCPDGIHVPDVSTVDFIDINSFINNSGVKNEDENIIMNDFENQSIDNSNQVALFDSNVLSADSLFFEDIRFGKSSIFEESDIANLLSHSSSCYEFKPDNDGDDQHLNEEDVRKSRELQEEALMLRKKIKALQSNENEIDTENEAEFENDNTENVDPQEIFTEYSHYLSQISSWGDQMDEMERFQEMLSSDPNDSIFKFQYGSIEQFREFVARHPGKALDLHYKLLGRSKRSNSDEQCEMRRKKAEEKRQKLLNRKAAKMRELLQRVEEVRQAQLQIIEERKCRIDLKLKKAEENRILHLKTIQKKAHDEEEKLKEIAFINELEAQNRRHDSMALRLEQEERLQNIMEERQRKVDEKAAKEAAVGERKRVLEAERMEKIEKIQQKRREKEEIIGKKQQERELERLVIAREKAREREERLQARQAAQIANVEELQKKIKKKQENSARRHEENIQHIRQKAVETAMLRNLLSEDSNSDVSSKNSTTLEKKKQTQFSISDIEQPSLTKNQRKRCKKIRSRLQKSGLQYFSQITGSISKEESSVFSNLNCNVLIITKLIDNNETSSDSGVIRLEKHLIRMANIVHKHFSESRSCFKRVHAFEVLQKVLLQLIDSKTSSISLCCKCIDLVCRIINSVCEDDISSIEYFVSCSNTCSLIDGINILFSTLLSSKLKANPSIIQISVLLLALYEMVLLYCSDSSEEGNLVSDGLFLQLKDVTSYLLCCGLLKKIGDLIKLASLEPVECKVSDQLVEPVVCFVKMFVHPKFFWREFEELLLSTDFLGTVSLLYGHLHQTHQILPSFTLCIIKFFKTIASEQRQLFQKVLGSEGISLQFRYIASFILQHCILSVKNVHLIELLNDTILVIGYFVLKNPENQLILQSGQNPTVLQQLISLPLQYFCVPQLKCVLFPTLIAMCDGNPINRELLENEMSYNHIESFLEDPISNNAELMNQLR